MEINILYNNTFQNSIIYLKITLFYIKNYLFYKNKLNFNNFLLYVTFLTVMLKIFY
ncbi:hypothetical protein CF65_02968 [Aggregatibacter actinomycetemcomitans HK1651]|nr:hypothetical protein CF65_02968 [Aggregatibacter actinomycetemcomitans HK1651]